MWQGIFEFVNIVAAVIFCALSVKLADDYLDQKFDNQTGTCNYANFIGNGTMIYAMLFLVIAAGLNATVSMPLFLACYIVGMFNDLKNRFPSRLNGFQESFLIILLGIFCFSWNLMLFSMFFIFGVQLLDDCLDVHIDRLTGQRNLAHRLGTIECVILGTMSFLTACWINEQLFWPVLCGTVLFYITLLKYQGAKV